MFQRVTPSLGCLLAVVCISSVASAGEIRWRSGTVQTEFTHSANAAAALAESAAGERGDAARHVVVQFDRPVAPEDRGRLRAAGVTLLNYLGDHAYFAAVAPQGLNEAVLADQKSLRAAVPIQVEWKLHPALAADEIMPWSIVPEESASDRTGDAHATDDDPTVAAYVLFHADVDLVAEGPAAVDRHGGTIRSMLWSVNGMVIELPWSGVRDLAGEDIVQYVEPPLPKFSELNNSNRERTGADIAQAAPYGLDGSGVTVLVYDGGTVFATHQDFGGRVNIRDGSGTAHHATHVAGTVGGAGTLSSGLYRGMAPGVVIESYGFETGGPLEAGFLYTDPGDIEADYDQAINTYGADIANNSIGTNTAPNGFPCEWEGDYGVTSALIDAIVRGSLGSPFRVVWANGNERQTDRCGSLYHTTAPPACAKNHITVGALNSNDDSVTSFTSWGPADDGRIKPDLAAPGCQSNDDNGVTSTSAAGGYTTHCGTSMASPTVCGLGALLLQDFRNLYPDRPDFRNSTLKALLAHTAVDIGNTGPDYQTGYGSVRVVPAIEQMRSGSFLEREVNHGDLYQLTVVVPPGTPELKVTIAWDDVSGTPNVSPALVNDLDLRILDPTLGEHFPWTLDPLNPAAPAVRTEADHVNNIEQVVIDTPTPGSYLVEITGFNVPAGPQPFSLVASPDLIDCSRRGAVMLSRTAYGCQSTATVEVSDCDLNADEGIAETIDVTVASDSEPDGEILTLTETGPNTGRFSATMDLDTVDAAGVLMVVELDTVTATYIDADDGFGGTNVVVTDTAVVDCTAPTLFGVAAVDIAPEDARIVFETDEPAWGLVRWGENCANLTQTVTRPGPAVFHSALIEGLEDNHTYYYEVEAADAAGNVAIDNQGGACYSFTTEEIPDYFTEQFTSGFDLSYRAILFVPDGSFGTYAACIRTITELPTDPTGGADLGLGDTDSARLPLDGGAEVLVYGTGYSTLYVNANGNITFDRADSDSTESYTDHFARPRVSALFDDLNPGLRGQVLWQKFADRAVVTWYDVTEDYQANSNTAQVEMYFDGRIQIAWLAVAAADGLVGLSGGGGQPPYFQPSDLSAFGPCGPRPPTATNRTLRVGQDRQTRVRLLASDDGTPDPPGALTYIITALPTQTLRDARNDYPIQAGDLPYTMTGGGNEVFYVSAGGFTGTDTFSFQVSDGGSPPHGGVSNTAEVTMDVGPVLTIPFYEGFPVATLDTLHWRDDTTVTIDSAAFNEPSEPFSARFNGHPVGIDALMSNIIDLSVVPAARLTYYWERTGGGNSPEAGEDLVVEFFDSGGVWQTLRQYPGSGPDMIAFEPEVILLPATALHENFRLRIWCSGTVSGASVLDDWFVDDISITSADAPLADNAWVAVSVDGLRDVTLHASDPAGDPISFVIVSLPAHGSLEDPLAGPVGPEDLPYTLAASEDVVRYTPAAAYAGEDAFAFLATDGAFESNVATVSIAVETVLTLPFLDTFPDPAFAADKWAHVEGATVDGLGIAEPSEPYAARFNGMPEGGDLAYTFALDLEGIGEVHLQYWWQRTGGGDSPETGDDLQFEYVNRLGNWQPLALHTGSGADMTAFEPADVLLPADAKHRDFRLRIRSKGDLGNVDDWFVDDVAIFAVHEPSAMNQALEVSRFGTADIALGSSDPDGDPLDHVIVSLPAVGQLIDMGSATAIASGDLPYTLVDRGRVVRYLPPLGYIGDVLFTFKASDGVYESNTATVSVAVGGIRTAYSFPMNSNPGWSTQGQWEFGVPQGLLGDPAAGYTGSNVYGYNLAGKYPNAMPVHYLTTTALDCSNLMHTTLRFRRWLGVERSPYDWASIQVSSDGAAWTTIWQNGTTTINEQAWSLQSYDISALADGRPTVYVRWGMGPSDGGLSYHGWNIDDVEFIGIPQPNNGDADGDGDIDGADMRVFAECLSGPGVWPEPPDFMTGEDCIHAFDFDADDDVDLADACLLDLVRTGLPAPPE